MSCALCLSFYGWEIQMNSLMGADISENNTYAWYSCAMTAMFIVIKFQEFEIETSKLR